MHEVFLTALVAGVDLDTACNLLAGLCSMPSPYRAIQRVLYYQGPTSSSSGSGGAAGAGLSNLSRVDRTSARRDAAVPAQYRELSAVLQKQSYVIQTRYDVRRDRDFGGSGAGADAAGADAADSGGVDLNSVPGVLRWADFPDVPPQSRPMVTQRKKIEIWDQRNLPAIMADNNYTFKNEIIEESFQFFRDKLEFVLHRHLLPKPRATFVPLSQQPGPQTPLPVLPPWDSLEPVDPAGRWLMTVRTHVQHNKPDEFLRAQDALMSVRKELEGAIEFRALDRKIHDTRVMPGAV